MRVIRCRLVVQGLVQGVGYRWSCRDEADRLGLAGWVRNRRDGAVEVVVEGETPDVERFITWCRAGPAHAQVTDVRVDSEQPEGDQSFRIVG